MAIEQFAYQPHTRYMMKDKLSYHVTQRTIELLHLRDEIRNTIKTPEQLKAYGQEIRKQFEKAAGDIPYDPSLPLDARITGVINEKGLDIEKVIFTSRPGVYVTANLYLPHQRRQPCGAVLFNPGHADAGKADKWYQDVARTIASAGLIVLLIDPVGQGERLSYLTSAGVMQQSCTRDHQYAGYQVFLSGDAPIRYFIADSRRAIDYLLSRPEVDPNAIGLTGSSGGGTMTINMMICEPRVAAAAPGTFLTTRKSYLYAYDPQDAEQIWPGNEEVVFDHYDALACFAPRPVLALCDDADFFPIEGTIDALKQAKVWYAMYGADNDLGIVVDHHTHAFTPFLAQHAAAFFSHVLNHEDRKYDPGMVKSLDADTTNCTQSGQIATEFPDASFIFDDNLARLKSKMKDISIEKAKAFVFQKVYAFRKPAELHLRELSKTNISGIVAQQYFWFTQDQMPNFAVLLRLPKDLQRTVPVTVCLFDRGTDELPDHSDKIRKLLNSGTAVFVPDIAGTGKCSPQPYNTETSDIGSVYGTIDTIAGNLLFIGDSLCALRLYDLERLPEVLSQIPNLGELSLTAYGNSGILANLYGLLHPGKKIDVNSCQTISDIVTNRYYEEYNLSGYLLPGIAPYALELNI